MINLSNKRFKVFLAPNADKNEELRIFRFDENTGHFQATMEPGTLNVYGVLCSSGRVEFNVTTHGEVVFTHFVGGLNADDAEQLWMAGTFIKFTLQTTGRESGKRFVLPFYAVERQ